MIDYKISAGRSFVKAKNKVDFNNIIIKYHLNFLNIASQEKVKKEILAKLFNNLQIKLILYKINILTLSYLFVIVYFISSKYVKNRMLISV